ncbi:hypothetical protein [Thiocystis violacea]|uniref:hypothetical protein n=1 Tax=Thiocystis violacea TaxID=13725 RepID=UPI001903A2D3|nr:hypothetical protein [Thiocystis violacea]MBK1720224.1 hypothetical protein [Thiocystis violacea]
MSPESSTDFANATPYTGLIRTDRTTSSRVRLAFLRGIVWSLIGMIYAPLFTGLLKLMQGAGIGPFSYILAAGLAGGAGAVLYGARELAIMSTGIGAAAGVAILILWPGEATLTNTVVVASVLAATVGLTVSFPRRCSRHVPGKLLAGVMTGAFGGTVLAIAEPLHPAPFSIFAVLAFLVSVNGILYVASVSWWVDLSRRLRLESRPCYLIESAIMAILASVAAGSVWMVSAPLLSVDQGAAWQLASFSMHREIQLAILGGLIGGGTAGILLEFFGFSWVHDI